ncbi:hypothetical protein [Nonomuraea jabiensis]
MLPLALLAAWQLVTQAGAFTPAQPPSPPAVLGRRGRAHRRGELCTTS